VINHPSPSQPTRVSARTPVLPMIPIPPPACGGSPPGSACEMNLRAAAASESPP
jgi:hypothetical protein